MLRQHLKIKRCNITLIEYGLKRRRRGGLKGKRHWKTKDKHKQISQIPRTMRIESINYGEIHRLWSTICCWWYGSFSRGSAKEEFIGGFSEKLSFPLTISNWNNAIQSWFSERRRVTFMVYDWFRHYSTANLIISPWKRFRNSPIVC